MRFKNYLKKGSLIKETDQYLWSPIHYAAHHNQYQQINVLLEIDPTASNIVDKDQKTTTLHLAAGWGHARANERILSLAAKCYELVDNRGWNFVHYAMVSFINEGDAKGSSISLGRLKPTITLLTSKMLVLDTFWNMAILRSKVINLLILSTYNPAFFFITFFFFFFLFLSGTISTPLNIS